MGRSVLRASLAHRLEWEDRRDDGHDDVQAGADVDGDGSGGISESETISRGDAEEDDWRT